MTGLLVSVRNGLEAQAALRGGADLIDVKEPLRGPMGPADPSAWREVQQTVAGRRPLSAALGELLDEELGRRAVHSGGFRWVKIGLAGCLVRPDWPRRWAAAVANLPPGVEAVPVAYADWQAAQAPPPPALVAWAASEQACGLVLDTFDKRAGPLTAQCSPGELHRFVRQVQEAGLQLVLAGRLEATAIKQLAPLQPDFFGVRGAVCRGGRDGTVDPALVKTLRGLLPRAGGPASARSLTRAGERRILPPQ